MTKNTFNVVNEDGQVVNSFDSRREANDFVEEKEAYYPGQSFSIVEAAPQTAPDFIIWNDRGLWSLWSAAENGVEDIYESRDQAVKSYNSLTGQGFNVVFQG